ncbi:MAG: hypothetical protein F4060_02350 [Holophagales bacterium]|nr:hypothetical protein [Holophagales bacterium]MYG31001.1 hypothetical protein [Holophagales bacterium]MYI78759.1 hypothetical protein [Holophagales bacterium]
MLENMEVIRSGESANAVPSESSINFIFIGCVVKELHADATSNPVVEEFEFTERKVEEEAETTN